MTRRLLPDCGVASSSFRDRGSSDHKECRRKQSRKDSMIMIGDRHCSRFSMLSITYSL